MAVRAPVRNRTGQGATTGRSGAINLRIADSDRNLIDAAAAASGKSRTDFMLESARERAVDVLLDQRLFALGPAEWDAFSAALDAPPPANDALKALMAKTPPWER